MKKLSRILMMLLSAILIVTNLSACASDNRKTDNNVTTATEETSNGMYVFSFLSRYYQNVRLIEETYRDEIYTEVYETSVGDMLSDNGHTFVNLPCGTGYVRGTSMILESLDVEFCDLTHSKEENHSTAIEAVAVFHALEGTPIMAGYKDTEPNDSTMKIMRQMWKDDFEESLKTFKENITDTASDPKVFNSMLAGETVLAYSGEYNYSLYVMNLGEVSADGKDHYIIKIKIEAN